jgi:hypothetical protein
MLSPTRSNRGAAEGRQLSGEGLRPRTATPRIVGIYILRVAMRSVASEQPCRVCSNQLRQLTNWRKGKARKAALLEGVVLNLTVLR